MNTQELRKLFESWVKSSEDYQSKDLDKHDYDDQPYISGDMQFDWQAWQACYSALEQQREELLVEVMTNTDTVREAFNA